MSKKSRRRNKKILAALALAGGAAMLGRRGASAADVDSGRGGDSASAAARVAANVTGTSYPGANKAVEKAVEKAVKKSKDSTFKTRYSDPDKETISKAERAKNLAANVARNKAANYYKSQTHDAAPVITATGRSTDQNLGAALMMKKQIENQKAAQAAAALSAGNQLPPSMRGGALHAQGYTPRTMGAGSGHPMRKFKKGGSVKKARVTGIARRGFGRALMKGKK